ncbi:MAG TPA: hypothetical protein VKZ53_01995 [Candidatus Angelobacter sp.]|nr:hypothetical protein [Candidatus Angelobacter sp.]
MRKAILIFSLVACFWLNAAAQKNQFSLVVGVKVTPGVGNANSFNGKTNVDNALGFEANYAHEVLPLPFASLQVELPLVFTTQSNVNSFNLLASKSYGALFATPALKLQFAPHTHLSPWVSAGAGLARFSPSTTALNGGGSAAGGTIKAAYQGGAGVDFRVPALHVTLRVEGREFFTGTPNLGVSGLNLRHNIMAGGGVVFNF